METKVIAYIALALLALYFFIRLAEQWAVKKLIQAEFEHVINNEEHKVKGRYQ
jgi:hypothetical protein